MQVKLYELKQGSLLDKYINDLDNFARDLQLSEQQQLHYFIFGLEPKLEQVLLIRQPQNYGNAVTSTKRKQQVTDRKSETELIELLQDIWKEVTLKHIGIKQEPYAAPVQDSHNLQL